MRLEALTDTAPAGGGLAGRLGLSRRVLLGGLLVLVLALVAATVLAPRAPRLGPQTSGDPELAAAVRESLAGERGYQGLAVAMVEGDRVRTAGLGRSGDPERPTVDAATAFEIGSITKALTGMLLAALATDGVVSLDASLHELLPDIRFADPAIGSITMGELASHRSGLPRLPRGADSFFRTTRSWAAGHDPYRGIGPDDVIAAAADSRPAGRGEYDYSNLGMAVAGHTAARRAGAAYPELLRERVLGPLGMNHTVVASPADPLPSPRAVGRKAGGQYAGPWRSPGYAPAGGGVWSTSGDLARLAQAMLDGTAPGADAARPRFGAGEHRRVGLGWLTSRLGGREITWHNGGTGGFGSFVGFDRAAGRAIVVLGNTDRDVDDIGWRLLGVEAPRGFDWRGGLFLGLTVFFPLSAGFGVLGVARRVEVVSQRRRADRLSLVVSLVSGVAVLLLGWRIGAWDQVPAAVWVAGVVVFAAGAWLGASRWQRMPTTAGPRPWRDWAGAIASIAFAGAILAVASGLV